MLQLHVLRDQTEMVIAGLQKRNLKDAESLVTLAIKLDKEKRDTQQSMDLAKAQINSDSKIIGDLMKQGKQDEATTLRNKVAESKGKIKSLEDSFASLETELTQLLHKIPNVPAEKVPAGKGAEDNLNVHQHGEVPTLFEGAQPH